jgi:superfamily II DNA or RNA helicase
MVAPFARADISLCNALVTSADGLRQERTAEEILRRLEHRPGLVLADEVGMGKTFVAMAVAASIALHRPNDGPVVVMAPPSLREKWPQDWEIFRERCLRSEVAKGLRHAEAESGVAFLRLLDDPPERKAHVIFLTHGALYRALTDGYAKLAVIKRAFWKRRSLDAQRHNFPKFAGRLLRLERSVEACAPGLLGELLERPYDKWLPMIQRAHPKLRDEVTDDPVPLHLQEALEDIPGAALEPLIEELRRLPLRESAYIDERLRNARQALNSVMKDIWALALREAHFRSPLLILDEAHHLKNPSTRLASLFVDEDAANESEVFESKGALGGKFERMLFLTATPFQLGHAELMRVLERFEGIAWNGPRAPYLKREAVRSELQTLSEALDTAQAAALRLDAKWGRLKEDDLSDATGKVVDIEQWWQAVSTNGAEGLAGQIIEHVDVAERAIRNAEQRLRPWVIRHLKPTRLEAAPQVDRRLTLPGAAITTGCDDGSGLEIDDLVLLPFLLAGRAQGLLAATTTGRALFAEGLASSFEAYVETRTKGTRIDEDGDLDEQQAADPELQWYLSHLDRSLPRDRTVTWEAHPKVRATAQRTVELWKAGEKVLVFCHYRATGRALRRHISALLKEEILRLGAAQLVQMPRRQVVDELERIGDRFFDTDGTLRERVTESVGRIVGGFPELHAADGARIVEVVRRFLRTPAFLVRYFDLTAADHALAFAQAIERTDIGGLSLRERIEELCAFLSQRIPRERADYLDALQSIQTGQQSGKEVAASIDASEYAEETDRVALVPNVRLANGVVKTETRRKLLLAFNTPLFPEVLIASSVLAEGVNLHLNCRHVIHHDLCWNPSTLEQRTGRVDRIGCRAEKVHASILVYLPYIAATQDEKMFRVVRDRERWFQIVMGSKYEIGEAATDRRASRVPLPETVQRRLTMHLGASAVPDACG